MQDDVLLDPSGLQLGQNAERRSAALELVLARLQMSRGAAGHRQHDEACAAPDPAGLVEAAGDAQNPVVSRNLDHHRSAPETVGIAYRRALLSAIHGAAPTWVKIENVLHEFSHLPGVMEDTLDIMMNLRKVVFTLHVNRPKILRLRAQGGTVVKASDFETDADIEVLTPDVVLATLDKDGILEMEVCVERGRGYVSAEKP